MRRIIELRAVTVDGPDHFFHLQVPEEVTTEELRALALTFVELHEQLPVRNGQSPVLVVRKALDLKPPVNAPEFLVEETQVPEDLRKAYRACTDIESPALLIQAFAAYVEQTTGHTLERQQGKPEEATRLARVCYGSLSADIAPAEFAKAFQ